jgi:hypothetical protein
MMALIWDKKQAIFSEIWQIGFATGMLPWLILIF